MSQGHSEPMQGRKQFLSADPARAMQEMMDTIDTLRSVYTRETDALALSDTKAFLSLQDEKMKAARSYQMGVEDILSRRDEMKNVSPALKKRLAEMQNQFSVLASENLEALARMRRTVSQLGETISSAAREAAKKKTSLNYGESGQLYGSSKKSLSMGISETA